MADNRRDRATRLQRRQHALAMRQAGATYRQIGRVLGCSFKTAHRYVQGALDEIVRETREDAHALRALEAARLDEMTRALWARRDEPQVADRLVRISERRCRLFGLDAPTEHRLSTPQPGLAAQAEESLGLLSRDDLTQLDALLARAEGRDPGPPAVE